MTTRHAFLFLLLGAFLGSPVFADEEIDQLFKPWDRADSPGCALAVMDQGEIIYSRGYGSAQLEYQVPITPQTPFHVASVSKQFTTFAVALLASRDELSLDADIHEYIPELPDFGAEITLRHLIHHISGLRDQWDLLVLAGWQMDDVITHGDVMALVLRQHDLNFPPGDQYMYCNTGYTLLAEVVKRVSGLSLRLFADREMFEPLAMTNTHFHDDHRHLVPGRAYSYRRRANGRGLETAVLSYAVVGATSLFTTVEDLAAWEENFYDPLVGDQAVLDTMLRRGVLNSGEVISYAGGLSCADYRGLPTVSHSGGDAAFRSFLLRFPEQHFSIAILANAANIPVSRLAYRIAGIYLADEMLPAGSQAQGPSPRNGLPAQAGAEPPAPTSEMALRGRVGTYYSDELDTIYRIRLVKDALFLHLRHYEPFRLTARGTGVFRFGPGEVRFDEDGEGETRGFEVDTGRVKNLRFQRLSASPDATPGAH